MDVGGTDAEFILDLCEHLAPDLRIRVCVAGHDQNIGVDLTGKRETAIDLKHFGRHPKRGWILALLDVKTRDQRDPGQRSVLGSC